MFRPEPGIVIIKPIQDKGLVITNMNQTKLLKGTVVACGPDVDEGDMKRYVDHYAQEGDTVYFLSYEGDYDNAVIDGEKYYMVKVDDLRTRV